MRRASAYRGLIALLVLPLAGRDKAGPAPADQVRVQGLIRQLGSDSFRKRRAAVRELAGIGEPAERALRKALDDQDPEVRRRAAALVRALVARHRVREMAALRGRWVLTTAKSLGEQTDQGSMDPKLWRRFARQRNPAEERELPEGGEFRYTLGFKGNAFEHQKWCRSEGPGEARSIEGWYYLDVDRSPKVMERWWHEEGIPPETRVAYCIYAVRGDTLLMAVSLSHYDDPRRVPRRFATAGNEDVVLLIFKREKR